MGAASEKDATVSYTELRKFLRTWLQEYCWQVVAEVVGNNREKILATMYKDFFLCFVCGQYGACILGD